MIGLFKKIIGMSPKKERAGAKFADRVRVKAEKFTNFIGEKSSAIKDEYNSIKEKCKDLRKSNYELGLKHLNNGNISEAIFRFRIIKRFWPDLLDANYQLAYCLALQNRYFEAKKVLDEFVKKYPETDDKIYILLDQINYEIEQQN